MLHIWMLFTILVTTSAQELPKGTIPEGWAVRLDGAAAHAGHAGAGAAGPSVADVAFVVMAPGWHITTGPSAIFYQPAQQASGTYSLKSDIFLFDPGTRNEAFGVLLGGQRLTSDDQSYTYFAIRRSGEFLIRRRTGAATADVTPWTRAASVHRFEDRAAGQRSVKNTLEVKVAPDTTAFIVNGTEVARVPTRDIDTEGIVGLRVNHALNLHVSALEIVR